MLTFMGTGCISKTLRRLVSNSNMMSESIRSHRGLSGLLQARQGLSASDITPCHISIPSPTRFSTLCILQTLTVSQLPRHTIALLIAEVLSSPQSRTVMYLD